MKIPVLRENTVKHELHTPSLWPGVGEETDHPFCCDIMDIMLAQDQKESVGINRDSGQLGLRWLSEDGLREFAAFKFCPGCGKKVVIEMIDRPEQEPVAEKSAGKKPKSKTKKGKK